MRSNVTIKNYTVITSQKTIGYTIEVICFHRYKRSKLFLSFGHSTSKALNIYRVQKFFLHNDDDSELPPISITELIRVLADIKVLSLDVLILCFIWNY